MAKAIIFDCFGVLTADGWHEFRTSLPAEQQGPASDLNHQYDAGIITKEEFISLVARRTKKPVELVRHVLDDKQPKNQQLLAYIQELKKRYKIGLLSNVASNWIREEFLNSEEQKLFDAYILSFEEGTTKPDPQMYQTAAERLGVLPEECIYIDDIDRYAAAAEDEGMKGIVYSDFTTFKKELEALLTDPNN